MKYPSCSFFDHPPFDTPLFRTFASTASEIIDQAEQEARHRLLSIPENIAVSLRGIVTSNNIQQEQSRRDMQEHGNELVQRLDTMETLLRSHLVTSKPTVKLRRARCSSALLGDMSSLSMITSPDAAPTSFSVSNSSPSNIIACSLSRSGTSNQRAFFQSQPGSSASGVIYRATTFPLSNEPSLRATQLGAMSILESKFSPTRLCHHVFEWKISTSKKICDEWLPRYEYPSSSSLSVRDIWTEWAFGLDGHLSTSELTAGWSARWRRNDLGAKTEASRRKKVIALIETLSKKPNWNSERALHFLELWYPIPTPSISHLRTTRSFIDYLQKNNGQFFDEIIKSANSYIEH